MPFVANGAALRSGRLRLLTIATFDACRHRVSARRRWELTGLPNPSNIRD